jgi:hypothetical protein
MTGETTGEMTGEMTGEITGVMTGEMMGATMGATMGAMTRGVTHIGGGHGWHLFTRSSMMLWTWLVLMMSMNPTPLFLHCLVVCV